ncbi:hypothetical protein GOP47_0018238 [Adiantum capillus-veneris]|uniref:Phosphoglycerate mutase-like protein n=1 Tax=Adiantum capillus-veneris TaxID=13818 RepID=A0A9D4UGP9_ADICA|nr:hypothetical protein GOP47_0017686 [Adiantum capillus-veneris]KAI5067710.1 hypothetical protein GOP47_0018238 [Adiantum capillus-veneris]
MSHVTVAGTIGAPSNLSVHSLRNCKIIHLVRHAQGYHNVVGEQDYEAYMSYDYVDASVTPLGWDQVDRLRRHLEKINLTQKVELVVTSPLMRTMQTAVGAFGGPKFDESDSSPPLMVQNGGGSNCPAVSSSGCPPFIAVELCREHMGVHPCDKRQSVSTYRTIFPSIDFSEIEVDDDTLWKPDVRETNSELIDRGTRFLEWLSRREEREIAVVSHSGFLTHLLRIWGQNCSVSIQSKLRAGFNNCEMRSIVLVNQRDLGAAIPEDYAGGSPPGPDVPSDSLPADVLPNGV